MNLFAFGSNGNGQLGLGHKTDVANPQPCRFTEAPDSVPSKIAGGGNFTFLLCECGRVFNAGRSPLGNDHNESGTAIFKPVRLPSSSGAKLCSASWESLVVVTECNEILVCGTGNKGELGLGPSVTEIRALTHIESFPPRGCEIVDISSGVYHFVVVLSNGDVFGWGNGRKGQLGAPPTICWEPRRIVDVGFAVRGVACGKEFSLLMGDLVEGQIKVLGSDKWNIKSEAPGRVSMWSRVDANWGGVVALKNDGKLISWGRNDRGQLGPAEAADITSIAAGSEHTLLLSGEGGLTCHGWGEHGNCGPHVDESGNAQAHSAPVSVPQNSQSQQVNGLGAGCATSFFWTGE